MRHIRVPTPLHRRNYTSAKELSSEDAHQGRSNGSIAERHTFMAWKVE